VVYHGFMVIFRHKTVFLRGFRAQIARATHVQPICLAISDRKNADGQLHNTPKKFTTKRRKNLLQNAENSPSPAPWTASGEGALQSYVRGCYRLM
ncbi:MAG: hypothetical protein K2H73_00720, partial [Treponemataceae bacterium]|nr:hypothetical protein [Treponemataceae bacterium]